MRGWKIGDYQIGQDWQEVPRLLKLLKGMQDERPPSSEGHSPTREQFLQGVQVAACSGCLPYRDDLALVALPEHELPCAREG